MQDLECTLHSQVGLVTGMPIANSQKLEKKFANHKICLRNRTSIQSSTKASRNIAFFDKLQEATGWKDFAKRLGDCLSDGSILILT